MNFCKVNPIFHWLGSRFWRYVPAVRGWYSRRLVTGGGRARTPLGISCPELPCTQPWEQADAGQEHESLEPRGTDLASGPRSLSCQWDALLLAFWESTLSLLQTYLFPFICPYTLPSFPYAHPPPSIHPSTPPSIHPFIHLSVHATIISESFQDAGRHREELNRSDILMWKCYSRWIGRFSFLFLLFHLFFFSFFSLPSLPLPSSSHSSFLPLSSY